MTGLRAALRIAVRDALRSRGRTALVAVMVLVPVMLAAVGSVLLRSDELDLRDRVTVELGADSAIQAWLRPSSDGSRVEQSADPDSGGEYSGEPGADLQAQPARLTALLGSGGNRLVPQLRAWSAIVEIDGRRLRADVVELDHVALGAGAPIRQVRGAAPSTPSEVVVSTALAEAEGARIGSRIRFQDGGPVREYTVVGLVTGSRLGTAREVVGLPGSLLSGARSTDPARLGEYDDTWFVVGPEPVTWEQVLQANRLGAYVLSRAVVADPPPAPADEFPDPPIGRQDLVTGAVVVALVLLQIALMVGPAVAVGARRNERMLALVAATGGSRRHLVLVVVGAAAVIGLVAGVAGALLGAGVGAVLVRVLRTWFGTVMPRADIALGDLVLLALVGALTAAAAAVLPALRVARVDVVAALSGRRRTSAPPLGVPLAGLLVALGGLVVGWFAAGRGEQALTVVGIGAAEIGLVLTSGAVVALLARSARRAPLGTRFALRDAARQRGRTAPAVAATLAAVAAVTTLFVFQAAAAQADAVAFRQNAPLGATYVTLGTEPDTPASASAVTQAVRSALPVARTAVRYGAQSPGDDEAVTSVGASLPEQCRGGACSGAILQVWFAGPGDEAVLAPDATTRAALAAGRAVVSEPDLLRPDGTVPLTVSRWDPSSPTAQERVVDVPAVLAPGPQLLDHVLAPLSLARELGVEVQPESLVALTTRAPTPGELDRLNFALGQLDPGVGAGTQGPYRRSDEPLVTGIAVALAVLVALAGTFTAVGLAAADARPDLGTLAAVGADPAVRRRIGAAQAAAVAGPGTLLGVAAGVLAGWVLIRLNSVTGYYSSAAWTYGVPAAPTLALLLGVPLLAVALGWLTVRSRLEVVRRRAS